MPLETEKYAVPSELFLLNVDVMDGVYVAKRGDEFREVGISENLDNCERAIDAAASRDPNDSMVAMRRTKPPIIGTSSSSTLPSSPVIASSTVSPVPVVPGINVTDIRGG